LRDGILIFDEAHISGYRQPVRQSEALPTDWRRLPRSEKIFDINMLLRVLA
jgi:hypothetical protein